MASVLTTISVVALALAVVCFIAAAVIFVKLKIWIVMADLSGKTAQQSIEQLRNQTGKAAPRKQHRSYVVNSGVLKRNRGTAEIKSKKTEPIVSQGGKTEKMMEDDRTTLLSAPECGTETLEMKEMSAFHEDGTVPLTADTGTTELAGDAVEWSAETAPPGEGTTVLPGATTVIQQPAVRAAPTSENFVIITDIVIIHTDEEILKQNDFH